MPAAASLSGTHNASAGNLASAPGCGTLVRLLRTCGFVRRPVVRVSTNQSKGGSPSGHKFDPTNNSQSSHNLAFSRRSPILARMNHEMWSLGRNYNIRVGNETLQKVEYPHSDAIARNGNHKARYANSITILAHNIAALDRRKAISTQERYTPANASSLCRRLRPLVHNSPFSSGQSCLPPRLATSRPISACQ